MHYTVSDWIGSPYTNVEMELQSQSQLPYFLLQQVLMEIMHF
jgi:hypothetical protein